MTSGVGRRGARSGRYSGGAIAAVSASLAVTVALGGCSSQKGDAETVESALTGTTCAVGASCELFVTLPKGLKTNETAVVSRDWVHMGDRSTVRLDAATFGGVANTGKGDVILGVKTKVGGLSTRGLAFLRLQSEVHGAFFAGSVKKEAQVIAPAVAAPPPGEPTKIAWNVSFTAATTANAVTVKSTTRVLPPGRYGAVQVQSKGILKLSAGAYYFDSFKSDSGTQVLADTTGGTVVVYVRAGFAHNGALQSAPRLGDVLLGLFSSDTLAIKTELDATVIAPNAQLNFLTTPNGNAASYDGVYFANRVSIDCDVKIVRHDLSRTGPGYDTVAITRTAGSGTAAPPLPPVAGTTPEAYKAAVLAYMTNLYNSGYDGETVVIPPHPENTGHQPVDDQTKALAPSPVPSPPAGSPAATVAGGKPAIVGEFPRLDPSYVDPPPATPPKTCPLGMGFGLPEPMAGGGTPPTPVNKPFSFGHPEDPSRDFDAFFAMTGSTQYGLDAATGFTAGAVADFNAGVRMFGVEAKFISAHADGDTATIRDPLAQGKASVELLGTTVDAWTFSQAFPTFHASLCGSLCSTPKSLLPHPIEFPVGPVTISVDAALEGEIPADLVLNDGGPNFTVSPMLRAYATVGGYIGVGLQLGVEGQLDVLRIDMPVDASLNWAFDNSPEVCAATMDLNTGLKFRFSTLNGNLALVARIDAFVGTIELARWQILSFDGLVYETPRLPLVDIPMKIPLGSCTIERSSCGTPTPNLTITDLAPSGQEAIPVPAGYGAGRAQCDGQYIIEIPESGLTGAFTFIADVSADSFTRPPTWDCLKEKGSATFLTTTDGTTWTADSFFLWEGTGSDSVTGACKTRRRFEKNPAPGTFGDPEERFIYSHLPAGVKAARLAVTATADCDSLPLLLTVGLSTQP